MLLCGSFYWILQICRTKIMPVSLFHVYNNLPKSTTAPVNTVDKSATDLGSRHDSNVISTSYNYRTDTINGKPVKIRITTTESYE